MDSPHDVISTVQFQLTKNDIVEASLHVGRVRIRRLTVGPLVFAAALAAIWFLSGDSLFLGMAVACAALGVATPYINRLRFRRYASNPKNRVMFLPRVLHVGSDYVESETEDGSTGRISLASILSVEQWQGGYFIRVMELMFHYIPLDKLQSDADRERLRERMREWQNQISARGDAGVAPPSPSAS